MNYENSWTQPGEGFLKEGSWALPRSATQKRELKKLLSKPLKAKDAKDKLYDLIGDDALFDDLDDLEKKSPNKDVRSVVRTHMTNLNIDEKIAYGRRLSHESVANIVVTGLNSSEARKLFKWLPDLLSIERKTGRYTSKSRDIHKRVSLKGNNVFVSDPGSGIDTFNFETMIKKQLADWKMKGKVGSSTHVQR